MPKSRKLVSLWLLISALSVVAMIVLGGYTRLTEAGLSITEWHPISGIIPPLNEKNWNEKFNLYGNSPEFAQKNFSITMEEFKQIFWIEYLHRLLGRIVGIIFIIPFVYFWLAKQLNLREKCWITFASILFATQGFFGWYMVKSGLIDDPNVSHYRLTLHMLTAIVLFGLLLWTLLSINLPDKPSLDFSNLTFFALILLILCFIQIGLGAMVAGLKAGLFYNTFPLMNGALFPLEIETSIENGTFFKSPAAMQFLHRFFGFAILAYSFFFMKKLLSTPQINLSLSAVRLLALFITAQFILGAVTLVKYVPINIALLHQFMAIAVFTILLFILHRLVYKQKS